jgi:hypothetical protein
LIPARSAHSAYFVEKKLIFFCQKESLVASGRRARRVRQSETMTRAPVVLGRPVGFAWESGAWRASEGPKSKIHKKEINGLIRHNLSLRCPRKKK